MTEPARGALRPKVLIVEDTFLIAAELQEVMLEAGMAVVGPAATTVQALSAIAHERPDFAVLEYNPVGEAVTPVALHLQDLEVPFIFMSASGWEIQRHPEFARARIFDKPADMQRLVRAVQMNLNWPPK